MTIAYIGLGSNVGDRLENLKEAIELLGSIDEVDVLRRSNVYETKPVGGVRQPDFLNGVIEIDTTLDARTLVGHLKRIERDLGRKPRERWGPREIDLDLLIFGDEEIDEPALTVPHKEIENRAFVLLPLSELTDRYAEAAKHIDKRGVRLLS